MVADSPRPTRWRPPTPGLPVEEVGGEGQLVAVPDVQAAGGVSFDAPEGTVTIDGENNHITKTARIGEIRNDGPIYTGGDSGKPIDPDPYRAGYDWGQGPDSTGPGQHGPGIRRPDNPDRFGLGIAAPGLKCHLSPCRGDRRREEEEWKRW